MKKILKVFLLLIIAPIVIIGLAIGINRLLDTIHAQTLSEKEKTQEALDRLGFVMRNEFSGYELLGQKEKFEAQFSYLEELVNSTDDLSEEVFSLEVIKAIATFQDPHTFIHGRGSLFKDRFPFRTSWYDGSFYLTSGQVDSTWIGSEIIGFNDISGDEVFNSLVPYTNAPNKFGQAYFMGFYASLPTALAHEGIIDHSDEIRLTLVNDAQDTTTVKLNSVPAAEINQLPDYYSLSQLYPTDEKPLWKQKPEQYYWYQILEDENVLYVRYAYCVDQGDIDAFWEEIFEVLDEKSPAKLVLDVRRNPGGDSKNHRPFIERISDHPINRRGQLYTLIDRGTGSAAIGLATDMKKHTSSILVGEPLMDRPSTTSDPTFFTLPHTEITLIVPSLYVLNTHVYDQRNTIAPDIFISERVSPDSYSTDEVMEYVLGHQLDSPSYLAPDLPEQTIGVYDFSPLRQLHLERRDSLWTLSIEGLLTTILTQQDGIITGDKYDLQVIPGDSNAREIKILLHGSEITAKRVSEDAQSLVSILESTEWNALRNQIQQINKQPAISEKLQRPFFQTYVQEHYHKSGYDIASKMNETLDGMYPNDPVVSIVDYELASWEGDLPAQFSALLSTVRRLIRRYYIIITTDKVMNDDYNAFILRE